MRTFYLAAVLAAVWVASPGIAAATFGTEERLPLGAKAPSFAVPLLQGGDFDLAPHLGKTAVVLDFWSIYCVACVQQMPELSRIHRQYRDRGLVTVGVDLDSFGTKRVAKFVEGLTFDLSYPVVIDKQRQAAAKYGVSVLPTTVIIDREGKVVYYHVGYAPGDEAAIEAEVRKAVGLAP